MFTSLRIWRRWLVLAALIALPVLTYWDTIFARFGLRDDYSVLREVHEEPGKVTAFCASHARPIFGWMLEHTFRQLHTIQDFQWGRLLGAFCAGLVGAGTTWVLVRLLNWRLITAALTGTLIVLLPGTQVIVGWSSCWGHLTGLIAGIAAFAITERGLRATRPWIKISGILLGCACMVTGALIYQSNVLFYALFLAAALPRQRGWAVAARSRWLGVHLGVISAGLGGAFLAAKALFALGVFAQSERIAFEPHLLAKFIWFLQVPLQNALSFLVINDDHGRTAMWHFSMAIGVGLVIAIGVVWERLRHGRTGGVFYALGLAGLPVLAYAVSLIAAEQWSTYRTIFALTGVVVVFFVQGLNHISLWFGTIGRWFTPVVLGLLALGGFGLARHQAYDLIAAPQMQELSLVDDGAKQIDPAKHPKVFLVTPDSTDSFSELSYADEFGSLSTASDWTPKEMLKDVMRERYPAIRGVTESYAFESSGMPPAVAGNYDVVINIDHRMDDLKDAEPSLKRGAHPNAWGYLTAWKSFGVEHNLHWWPALALLIFGVLVLLGLRSTSAE